MRRATFDGWAKRDGVLENFLPRNASAGVVNTAGVAWTWSAYGQIVASEATPFVPHGVHLLVRGQMLLGGVLVGVNLEYEIATGAAGSEQAFFRYVDALAGNINVAGIASLAFGRTVPCGPTVIPAGTRLSHRVRVSAPATDFKVFVGVYLTGYDGGAVPAAYRPYSYRAHLAGVHGAQTRSAPVGSTLQPVSASPYGTYGAWLQILASAPADLLVWGAARQYELVSLQHCLMELGTGAAGSEVPRARLAFPSHSLSNVGLQELLRPLFVKKGERLAVRLSDASGGTLGEFQFFYEEV